ncbi:uncharacterized protein LOC132740211 [Ruditapes philippinarum]|uniref:uncharacterized protein LOC132740211 n=1 Tax=Ruditapes philippinarum TaxID=129788 RepID=UPI00295B3929|nr:uncharacterized protein LOC132740211 [Ruditapes philippinarum]
MSNKDSNNDGASGSSQMDKDTNDDEALGNSWTLTEDGMKRHLTEDGMKRHLREQEWEQLGHEISLTGHEISLTIKKCEPSFNTTTQQHSDVQYGAETGQMN